MLYYLYNEGNLKDSNQFWAFLHRQFSKEVGEKVMTLGQQAVQQAVKQAVQQAVEQAVEQTKEQQSREIALCMLDEGVNIPLISKITKLSIGEVQALSRNKPN